MTSKATKCLKCLTTLSDRPQLSRPDTNTRDPGVRVDSKTLVHGPRIQSLQLLISLVDDLYYTREEGLLVSGYTSTLRH